MLSVNQHSMAQLYQQFDELLCRRFSVAKDMLPSTSASPSDSAKEMQDQAGSEAGKGAGSDDMAATGQREQSNEPASSPVPSVEAPSEAAASDDTAGRVTLDSELSVLAFVGQRSQMLAPCAAQIHQVGVVWVAPWLCVHMVNSYACDSGLCC